MECNTLSEQTADKLMEYILKNKMCPGDKMPNEFELAELLSVGRSTVREAVRILVSRNVLIIKRGAGTYIADNTGVPDDPLGLSFYQDKYALATDLIEVRLILEPEIAALAAVNATDEDIAEITERCNRVEERYRAGMDHITEDIGFHTAIARCSGNRVIEKLVPIINTSVALFCNLTARSLREETIVTHRGIAEAIAAHDSAGAKYAMLMHLIYNRSKIEELVKAHKTKTGED